MAPGPIGPRLIYAEPTRPRTPRRLHAVGRSPPSACSASPRGGSTAVGGVITLATSFVPVTLRGRYEGAGESPQLYRFLVPDPDGRPLLDAQVDPAALAALRASYRSRAAALALVVLACTMLVVSVPVEEWRRRRRTWTDLAIASGVLLALAFTARVLVGAAVPDAWTWQDPGHAPPARCARSSAPLPTCSRRRACCWRWLRLRPICSSADDCARDTARRPRPPRVTSRALRGPPCRRRRARRHPARAPAAHRAPAWRTRASTRSSSRCTRSTSSGSPSCSASSRCTPPRCGPLSSRCVSRHCPGASRGTHGTCDLPRRPCGCCRWAWRAWSGLQHRDSPATRRLLAAAVAAVGLTGLVRRVAPRYRHGSQAFRLLTSFFVLAVPAVVFYPTIVALTQRAIERVISDTLGPQAVAHRAQLQLQLRESLQQIDRLPRLSELVAAQVRTAGRAAVHRRGVHRVAPDGPGAPPADLLGRAVRGRRHARQPVRPEPAGGIGRHRAVDRVRVPTGTASVSRLPAARIASCCTRAAGCVVTTTSRARRQRRGRDRRARDARLRARCPFLAVVRARMATCCRPAGEVQRRRPRQQHRIRDVRLGTHAGLPHRGLRVADQQRPARRPSIAPATSRSGRSCDAGTAPIACSS